MQKNLIYLFSLVMIVVVSLSNTAAAKDRSDNDGYVPGVLVVKFSEQEQLAKLSANNWAGFQDKYQVTRIVPLVDTENALAKRGQPNPLDGVYYVYYASSQSPVDVAHDLVASGMGIAYAEPKYNHYLAGALALNPNDPMYAQQPELPQVKAADAWEITRGQDGDVVIAIIDGGTQITHSDLAGNIWTNPGEIPNDNIDNDKNGYIDDVHGWNFALDSNNPAGLPSTPLNANHGTHTAGIAAAVTDNASGMAGISWNAKLMAVNSGSGITDNSITHGYDGIKYAADNGAAIISCSWGRSGGASQFEQDVIDYATSLGSVVVGAAGNDNSNYYFYPASYKGVFSVAAVDPTDKKAGFSNYGPSVDVSAPGTRILGTVTGGGYERWNGTSMACPLAAGVMALVKTKNPSWTGVQAAEQVRISADNIDGLNPAYAGNLGRGRVNAFRALTLESPSVRIDSVQFYDNDEDDIIGPGSDAKISVWFRNYLKSAQNISFELTCSDPYITITKSTAEMAELQTLQRDLLDQAFSFTVAENVPSGHVVDMNLKISSADYEDADHIRIMVLPTFATTDGNDIRVTVTNIGRIGFADIDVPFSGDGFTYKESENLLFEGAIIAGTGVEKLSNAARGIGITSDADFTVATDGDLRLITPGTVSTQETYGIMIDGASDKPLPVKVVQATYESDDEGKRGGVIFKYKVTNRGQTDLNNFHFGLFFDWDMFGDNYGTNKVGYDGARKLGYAYDTGTGFDTHVGVSLITAQSVHYRAIYNNGDLAENPSWGIYDGFSDAEKWESISGGVQYTEAGPEDISMVLAAGPVTIPVGSTEVFVFALLGGDNLADLQQNADTGRAYWFDYLEPVRIDDSEDQDRPLYTFKLEQNFPNPFNPVTNIRFTLDAPGPVELNIYNALGQRVARLVTRDLPAGDHEAEWNATGLASGVYIYQLQSGKNIEQKKMLLIK